MSKFRKHLMIGLAAAGIAAGSAASYAGMPGGGGGGGGHGRFGEHAQEFMAKRQAELHDKLKLSAGQEAAWNAFNDNMKPGTPPQRPDRDALAKLTAPERMEKMLEAMQERQKRMAERVAATKTFYATLTPEQQKIFNEEFGPGRHHGSK